MKVKGPVRMPTKVMTDMVKSCYSEAKFTLVLLSCFAFRKCREQDPCTFSENGACMETTNAVLFVWVVTAVGTGTDLQQQSL